MSEDENKKRAWRLANEVLRDLRGSSPANRICLLLGNTIALQLVFALLWVVYGWPFLLAVGLVLYLAR